jgi:xylulokinase
LANVLSGCYTRGRMQSPSLILAHDLGTTGNKASLFNAQGRLVSSVFAGYSTAYPQPNWVEQEPEEWWRAVVVATQQLLAQSGADPASIAAISFSGQMMGCVPLGADGRPLRSCIIWADQRAQAQANAMAERCDANEVYRVTGHRTSPAYSAPKILWLREHQPEIYRDAICFLQPKDYIIFKFTGELVTDYSDASGTLLFDLSTRRWHQAFLDALDLPAHKLPTPHPSTTIAGKVSVDAAAVTGLKAGTPVVIGGGDGACAGVGAGVVEPGSAYCYIGSSSWISVSSVAPVIDPQARTFTFHHLHPERYCPMGTMQAAGGAREWAWALLRNESMDMDAFDDLDSAAAQVPPGASGVIFLPYLMGERSPYWDPLARAAWLGMAMPTGKAELARAVLEGVALNLRLIAEALRAQVSGIDRVRLIGGGSRSPLWRQILANCLRLPVQTLALKSEATAWGAAVAGGVGVGLYGWEIAAQQAQVVETVEPDPAELPLYDELAAIYADSYAALAPIYQRLHEFSHR